MQTRMGEGRHDGCRSRRVHRPDIEGLRAISILAVALYHAQVGGMAGGFVGVDIFFVISGFLITGFLLEEATTTGRIDLLRFWARRARRLLPNALIVLVAILVIGAVILPRYLHKTLINDVASAVLYIANFRFAAQAVEYFRPAGAGPSLALHFWSLSIEEQFYLGWPLLLLGVALAFPRRIVVAAMSVLVFVWVASLATGLMMVGHNQPVAFFHTAARCWQLATGGLLAVTWPLIVTLPPRLRSLTTWAGLAGIGLSIGLFDDEMIYPGAWALLPTLSVAAVIAGGQAHGVLGWRPLQWLGARSYSWYLWHWPVLLLAKALFPTQTLVAVLSLPLSLGIAATVYAYFEDPIRRGDRLIMSPKAFIGISAAAAAVVVLAGALFGFVSQRVLPPPTDMASRLASAGEHTGRRDLKKSCSRGLLGLGARDCVYGAADGKHRAVLFGDSHADQWLEPLALAAEASGWRLDTKIKVGCPPTDIHTWSAKRNAPFPECDTWRAEVIRALSGPMKPDLVFVSSWTAYTKALDRTGRLLNRSETDEAWRTGFSTVLQRLMSAGVKVLVIRDTPPPRKDFASCLIRGGGPECSAHRIEALASDPPEVAVATRLGVGILDFTDQICGHTVCPVLKDGILVYRDHNHITGAFARTFVKEFMRKFENSKDPRTLN
jgi:peptidoglycan/LPS O-acetylase OafA/YrhL